MEDEAAVQKAMRAAGYGGTPGKTVEDATELAALRRDAERYRWLRAKSVGSLPMARVQVMCRGQYQLPTGEAIDIAIDAAMQGPPPPAVPTR